MRRTLLGAAVLAVTQVRDVTASGTYALVPVATTGPGTRLLRIRRSDGKIYFSSCGGRPACSTTSPRPTRW